jgi:hypothetical protein
VIRALENAVLAARLRNLHHSNLFTVCLWYPYLSVVTRVIATHNYFVFFGTIKKNSELYVCSVKGGVEAWARRTLSDS